jgi:hypothetical protein
MEEWLTICSEINWPIHVQIKGYDWILDSFHAIAAKGRQVSLTAASGFESGNARGPNCSKLARSLIREKGHEHTSELLPESQGTAHEWQTWRRDLHNFASRLFQ